MFSRTGLLTCLQMYFKYGSLFVARTLLQSLSCLGLSYFDSLKCVVIVLSVVQKLTLAITKKTSVIQMKFGTNVARDNTHMYSFTCRCIILALIIIELHV